MSWSTTSGLLTLGVGLLLVLALGLHSRRLATTATAVLVINFVLLIVPALRYAAPNDRAAKRTLRVAALNTWIAKGQANRISDFIGQTDADVILLQEIGQGDQAAIIDELAATYPYVRFDPHARSGSALLSKQPWTSSGTVPTGRGRPLAVWVRFDQDGQSFETASVHMANPFEWRHQPKDIDRLIGFALKTSAADPRRRP